MSCAAFPPKTVQFNTTSSWYNGSAYSGSAGNYQKAAKVRRNAAVFPPIHPSYNRHNGSNYHRNGGFQPLQFSRSVHSSQQPTAFTPQMNNSQGLFKPSESNTVTTTTQGYSDQPGLTQTSSYSQGLFCPNALPSNKNPVTPQSSYIAKPMHASPEVRHFYPQPRTVQPFHSVANSLNERWHQQIPSPSLQSFVPRPSEAENDLLKMYESEIHNKINCTSKMNPDKTRPASSDEVFSVSNNKEIPGFSNRIPDHFPSIGQLANTFTKDKVGSKSDSPGKNRVKSSSIWRPIDTQEEESRVTTNTSKPVSSALPPILQSIMYPPTENNQSEQANPTVTSKSNKTSRKQKVIPGLKLDCNSLFGVKKRQELKTAKDKSNHKKAKISYKVLSSSPTAVVAKCASKSVKNSAKSTTSSLVPVDNMKNASGKEVTDASAKSHQESHKRKKKKKKKKAEKELHSNRSKDSSEYPTKSGVSNEKSTNKKSSGNNSFLDFPVIVISDDDDAGDDSKHILRSPQNENDDAPIGNSCQEANSSTKEVIIKDNTDNASISATPNAVSCLNDIPTILERDKAAVHCDLILSETTGVSVPFLHSLCSSEVNSNVTIESEKENLFSTQQETCPTSAENSLISNCNEKSVIVKKVTSGGDTVLIKQIQSCDSTTKSPTDNTDRHQSEVDPVPSAPVVLPEAKVESVALSDQQPVGDSPICLISEEEIESPDPDSTSPKRNIFDLFIKEESCGSKENLQGAQQKKQGRRSARIRIPQSSKTVRNDSFYRAYVQQCYKSIERNRIRLIRDRDNRRLKKDVYNKSVGKLFATGGKKLRRRLIEMENKTCIVRLTNHLQ